jgi:hypothetical protein
MAMYAGTGSATAFQVINTAGGVVATAGAQVALGAAGTVADVIGGQMANSRIFGVRNGRAHMPLRASAQRYIAQGSELILVQVYSSSIDGAPYTEYFSQIQASFTAAATNKAARSSLTKN